MKKDKKHKWKYRINIRKKVLVLVVLGVFLFVGIGFSILESNLGLGGTIEVSKYRKTLYKALQTEVSKGYALKYTGSHQDSMDSTKSTKDIYYFYGADEEKAKDILDKNNVVFAGSCWQMIRTTDTGGVRMIYNGDPEEIEVDGETRLNCGDTRNLYHIGIGETIYNLSGSAVYAKKYTATTSGTTTTFTLVDDPDDPDDYKVISINEDNAETQIADIIENYPYRCSRNTNTCTGLQLYKVTRQTSGTYAYVRTSVNMASVGSDVFNAVGSDAVATNSAPLTTIGYMYGDVYKTQSNPDLLKQENFIESETILSSYVTLNTSYKYSMVLNSIGNSYELDNPILGSDIANSNYSGYYTYGSSSIISGGAPYYIAGKYSGSKYYYVQLSENMTLSDFSIKVGTDLVDNGNDTYTIKNGVDQATVLTPSDWYSNYGRYTRRYTCGDNSDTCTNPRYITTTTKTSYKYIKDAHEKFTIAKTRNGLDISEDYLTISKVDWYTGYNTTYKDYAYTCGNTDTVCTESNLRYIKTHNATNYIYASNHYFGASVKYEDNVYKLQDTIPLENAADMANLSSHHYICLELGETECSSVAYVFHSSYYILLNDPNITSVDDAIDAMLKNNTTDSKVKGWVDKWYELSLLNTIYEAKVDDTIYCNDRSYNTTSGYTFAESGWNANGGEPGNALYFKAFSNPTKDLSCDNLTDRFSVSNNDAKLTYKVGLLTAPELDLLNQNTIRKTGSSYWILTPGKFSNVPSIGQVSSDGEIVYSAVNFSLNIRPAISLIKGTSYSTGDGSMTNPYIVDMSN